MHNSTSFQLASFVSSSHVCLPALISKGMASLGEASLLRISRGLVRPLPGGNGPVNAKRMEEIRSVIEMLGTALVEGSENMPGGERLEAMVDVLQDFASFVQDEEKRGSAAPVLIEISTVVQMVAVEVLEIRGSRAMRSVLRLLPTG